MPFPSTKVIHDQWSAHHQPTAQGAMTAKCRISSPGTGEPSFDDSSGYTTPAEPVQHYDGPCRLQVDFRPTGVVATDQATADRRYLVAITVDATTVREQMDVLIYECPHAPQVVGRALKIQAIDYGSEQFELDLICVEAEFQGG